MCCIAAWLASDWLESTLLVSDWSVPLLRAAVQASHPQCAALQQHQPPHAAGEGTRTRHQEDTGSALSGHIRAINLWEMISAENEECYIIAK